MKRRKPVMTTATHRRLLRYFGGNARGVLIDMLFGDDSEAAALLLQGHTLGMWHATPADLRRARRFAAKSKSIEKPERKATSMPKIKSAEQKAAVEQRKNVLARLEPALAACHAGRELEEALDDPVATRAQKLLAAEHFLVLRRIAGAIETPVETLLYSVVTAHRKPH